VSFHQIQQAIVTVLAVIDPVVCGSIFDNDTAAFAETTTEAAVRVTLSILVILKILSVFNISLDVFKIVGGMIIAYMGFDMLGGGDPERTCLRQIPSMVVSSDCSRIKKHFSYKTRFSDSHVPT
jgi:small neutral amino acid transporter SnatA (MarC family)